MSKHTQEAMIDVFMELLKEKSFDKITVKEIIEGAEINRNTFYYHYEDIYDLLESAFQREVMKFREDSRPENTFGEEYLRTVRFLMEHKEAIIHLYRSKSRRVIISYVEFAVSSFIGRFVEVESESTKLSLQGKEYITYFYSDAVLAATLRWVEGKMKGSQEDLMETIENSFYATIGPMIDAYIQVHGKN